jgi:hypothetical protein
MSASSKRMESASAISIRYILSNISPLLPPPPSVCLLSLPLLPLCLFLTPSLHCSMSGTWGIRLFWMSWTLTPFWMALSSGARSSGFPSSGSATLPFLSLLCLSLLPLAGIAGNGCCKVTSGHSTLQVRCLPLPPPLMYTHLYRNSIANVSEQWGSEVINAIQQSELFLPSDYSPPPYIPPPSASPSNDTARDGSHSGTATAYDEGSTVSAGACGDLGVCDNCMCLCVCVCRYFYAISQRVLMR